VSVMMNVRVLAPRSWLVQTPWVTVLILSMISKLMFFTQWFTGVFRGCFIILMLLSLKRES
jgi:hypothetical protein